MLKRGTLGLLGLLVVGLLAGSAAADIFRGRFRAGFYLTVAAGGQMTWAQIAAQTGIVSAVEMSSLSDIQTGGFGTTTFAASQLFSYDATKNAMKVAIPASWPDANHYWAKSLPHANGFGEGQEMWVQFDVQYDAGLLTPSNGGGGFKTILIDQGFQQDGVDSNSRYNLGNYPMNAQIVMSTKWGWPMTTYTAQDEGDVLQGFDTPLAGGDYWEQNKRSTCKYHAIINQTGDDCIRWLPNTWYTFTIRIKIGTFSSAVPPDAYDSQIDYWVSYQGLTAPIYLHSAKNWNLYNMTPASAKYGKVWLTPYDQGRTNSTVDGNVWYRHVVIASQALKDPTSGTLLVPDGDPVGYPSTLTAIAYGISAEDKVGQLNQTTPNGNPDEKVTVAGLRSTPTKVRITNGPNATSGTWEWPFATNWIIDVGTTSVPTATYWHEPFQLATVHVKVWYEDNSTDEVDAVPVGAGNPTLTVSKTGTGTVTSSVPSGAIACGGDCTEQIVSGTAFTMSASPGTDYLFSGWSGGGCSGTGACSLTLTNNTTVTAVFTSTTIPGNLASMANNSWLQLTPAASSRYIPAGNPQVSVTVTGPVASSTPESRAYSGITYGAGSLYYFGGGHWAYAGNDVERYNIFANTWIQSYVPEVCPNQNVLPECGNIYSGGTTPYHTALSRPYIEHMFGKNYYNAATGHFEVIARGGGNYSYDQVAQTLTQIPVTLAPGGWWVPWASDIHYSHAFYAPDLADKILIITSTAGAPAAVYRQNGGAGTVKYWAQVGTLPAALAAHTLYSTYVSSLNKHFIVAYPYNFVPGAPRTFWWLDTVTMTFTQATLATGANVADEYQYDSHNNRLIGIKHNANPMKLWDCTAAFPNPSCTSITLSGAPTPLILGVDVLADMPVWAYDDVDNVFWYALVSSYPQAMDGGLVTLWAYRYAN